MNKQVDGAVAISVGTGGRRVGKVIRSAWWSAALTAVGIGTPLGVTPALAQSATWLAAPTVTNPADGHFDFNANANWNPATVPGSASNTGTATFGASNGTGISFSNINRNTLGGFTFAAGASNYTFSNGGVLIFNGAGIIINGGSAAITNNGGATVFFNTSTAASAAITNNSSGNTSFLDSSNAGSAAITNNNGGSTQFQVTSNAGSATITNNNGGITQFQAAGTAGNATITNNGGGVTKFGFSAGTDTASAGNATITNNSANTTFFANTTAGSATITNNSGGSTQFNDTASAGTAAHITNNSGGFTEFFANTTAGSATITSSGGSTVFANASTAGSAVITNNGGSLTQFNNTSTAGNATITNNGTVAFLDQSNGGAAHLINGAGGTIDFSGSTGPNGDGRLSVGSLAGSGTFIVGQQQVVTVTGSLAFTSGALYLVQVSGQNAGQIAVNGTATLAGNVGVDVLSRLTQKTTYTILFSANPQTGAFSSVSLEPANNFARDPVLTYVGNTVLLTLQPGLLSPALTGANANQKSVAAGIDTPLIAGSNLPAGLGPLFGLSGGQLNAALTQASGETATGAQQTTFNAMTQFVGTLLDHLTGAAGPASTPGATPYAEASSDTTSARDPDGEQQSNYERDAYGAVAKIPARNNRFDPHWSVWASGFGGSQTTDGNATVGSNSTNSSFGGVAVGADYLLSPRTIAGFALAGGGTSFSVANGGSGRSDLFQAGAFIKHTEGAAYISGALAYGWQDITTDRTVTIGGVDRLHAEFNAIATTGRVEGGYRFVTPWTGGIGVTPYAAAQVTMFDLPAYAESALSGANNFALAYAAKSVTDTRSELGIRTDKSFAMQDSVLTLRGRFAWAHDYDPDRSIAATFQTLPGASFVVNGAAQASDSVLTTASAEFKWINGWSAAATFEGEFSNVTASYAGKGVVRYVW
jgi:uncharacterized protein with beta-barrel porin domain